MDEKPVVELKNISKHFGEGPARGPPLPRPDRGRRLLPGGQQGAPRHQLAGRTADGVPLGGFLGLHSRDQELVAYQQLSRTIG